MFRRRRRSLGISKGIIVSALWERRAQRCTWTWAWRLVRRWIGSASDPSAHSVVSCSRLVVEEILVAVVCEHGLSSSWFCVVYRCWIPAVGGMAWRTVMKWSLDHSCALCSQMESWASIWGRAKEGCCDIVVYEVWWRTHRGYMWWAKVRSRPDCHCLRTSLHVQARFMPGPRGVHDV